MKFELVGPHDATWLDKEWRLQMSKSDKPLEHWWCEIEKPMIKPNLSYREFHQYTNKRGEKFTIAAKPDGGIEIFKYNGQLIFKAQKNWSIEQSQKWCEI